MTVINTNVAAQVTANAMKTNAKNMETTMERLATGTRINSASDDAAGLGIGSKMTSQIRGLDQAVRNANDAISMLATADGASVEISNMLQRMRELAVQAKSDTNSSSDLINLNKEFAQLATEIDRVSDKTTFNGQQLLDGTLGAKSFNVGPGTSDTLGFTFVDFGLAGGTTAGDKGVDTLAATFADFTGLADSDVLHITDSNGVTIVIDGTAITASTTAGGGDADTTFDEINDTTELLAVLNDEIDDSAAFGQVVATYNGAFTEISFTQDTAGVGAQITSVKKVTSTGVQSDFGTLTRTLNGSASSADGTPMAANLSAFTGTGQAQLSTTLGKIDDAITGMDKARANFGAVINRLEYTVDNLNSIAQNTRAARSAVMDADYASETTELARTQIISQASTAMLSQANQQAQSVLALLK
jgi:flagellin